MLIGDIDGDGDVETADLPALPAVWSGYDDECILADFDLSGEVGTADLPALVANRGEIPMGDGDTDNPDLLRLLAVRDECL